MGVSQTVARLMNNPLPEGRVDDILRPEGENPLVEHGYATARFWWSMATRRRGSTTC